MMGHATWKAMARERERERDRFEKKGNSYNTGRLLIFLLNIIRELREPIWFRG